MIYLDTSVALAEILTEQARPVATFWDETFIASRLLQYEIWNRLHARQSKKYRHERARRVLKRVILVEMSAEVLLRALQPFPDAAVPRTLDALHLATMVHLRDGGRDLRLASYDRRLRESGVALGFELVDL